MQGMSTLNKKRYFVTMRQEAGLSKFMRLILGEICVDFSAPRLK